MKLSIEPTSKIVTLNGVPARIWEGRADDGTPVHVFVARVGVPADEPAEVLERFEQALEVVRPPSAEVKAYPARLVL